jgi:hypothetical protein
VSHVLESSETAPSQPSPLSSSKSSAAPTNTTLQERSNLRKQLEQQQQQFGSRKQERVPTPLTRPLYL